MALTGYVSGLIIQSVPTRGRMKVDRFTADGTWTVPAGVTYAVAHMRGGGGGSGTASSGTGGTSSVAFAAGTVSAAGGTGLNNTYPVTRVYSAAPANSGQGSIMWSGESDRAGMLQSYNGVEIVAGGAVTAGEGITVTVGAGGVAGTGGAAGGSGYVWIEYLA
jgi:hypothetical protein